MFLFFFRRFCDFLIIYCFEEYANFGFGERVILVINELDILVCIGERKLEFKVGFFKCWCFLKIIGSGYLNWIFGFCF